MAVAFDVLSADEKGQLQQKLGRNRLPQGALAKVRNVICVASGQGRRRQVDGDREPRRGAGARGPLGGRARRRRVGLQHAAHARRAGQAARLRGAQDPAARFRRRREGDVDRLLRRGGRGRRVARADAAQGDPAVPRGRRLGRARLPAGRPAARDRRRLDDARPAAAPGARSCSSPRRSRRRRRSRTARPRWRPSSTSRSSAWSRTCPASRPRTARATRSSARAAASCSPTRSARRCSARSRFRRSCACRPTRACRSSPRTRTRPRPRR